MKHKLTFARDFALDILLVAQATIRARIWDFLLVIFVLLIALAALWAVAVLRAPIPPPQPGVHPSEQTIPEGMWVVDTTSDTLIGLPDHSRRVRRLNPPERIEK